MEWEKIFANDATDKVLISKIHKQLLQLNIKKKKPNQKIGVRPKQTFLQRRNTDGQQAHEKMFNISNDQSNANQNYSKVPHHTGQNGYHQMDKQKMVYPLKQSIAQTYKEIKY